MSYDVIRASGMSLRQLGELTGFSHQSIANALRDETPDARPELHAMLRLLEVEMQVHGMLKRYPDAVAVLNTQTWRRFGSPKTLGGRANCFHDPNVADSRFELRTSGGLGRVLAIGVLQPPPKRQHSGGASVPRVMAACQRTKDVNLRNAALTVLNSTTSKKGPN